MSSLFPETLNPKRNELKMCGICQNFNDTHNVHCPNGLNKVLAWSPSSVSADDARVMYQDDRS